MFTSKYRYALIVLLSVYSYANTLFSEVYHYYGIHTAWYNVLLLMTLITLLVWEGNRLFLPLLQRVFKNPGKIRFLLLFFLSGTVIAGCIAVGSTYAMASWLRLPVVASGIAIKLAFTYGTRVNLFMHILNATVIYIDEYKSKQLEAEELKRINAQAQLQAIKNQVNPHFLFNNLNVLSGMVMKDNPDANKFIEEFSKVYRHILNSQDKELVPLGTELEFIKPYVFLLEKRFPDSVIVDLEIEKQYIDYYIVPASLQMLVENAIKHNILSKAKPLVIRISVNKKGDLFVKNNLQPKPQLEGSTQVGLRNIAQRYDFITGQQIEIVKEEDSFTVTLPLIQQPA